MTVRGTRRFRWGWRRLVLGAGCAGLAAAGIYWARGVGPLPAPHAVAAEPPLAAAAPQEPAPAAPAPSDDYCSAPVAVLADRTCITREELGEYLIARFGEKLEHLVNKLIIEEACAAKGIEVNGGEIEQALSEQLKDLNIERSRFIKEYLKARHKNLYEWKEDNLRPQMLMTKLCRDRVAVTEEDLRKAFESHYGEKVECRVIEWPKSEELLVKGLYPRLRDSEDEFRRYATQQQGDLAPLGGKLKPFGRYTLQNEALEKEAFNLQPGQVSGIITVPAGFVVIKCDKRIPADGTVSFEKVRDELAAELKERKAMLEFAHTFKKLHDEADPKLLLVRDYSCNEPYVEKDKPAPGESRLRVVAYLHGSKPVTREQFGEYLIARYGHENLELLINKRIIENTCRAKGITAEPAEIEAELVKDCAKKHMKDRRQFAEEVLKPNRTSMYQYMDDVLRPRVLLTKLCRDRVKVTDEDLQAAFRAYHGEKVECRMIMWPRGEEKIALSEYARLRDSDEAFDAKARTQASPTLAKDEGKIPPIGWNTAGNEEIEREAFALRPGQVSRLIGTPDGLIMLKCVRHLEQDKDASLEACREQLEREIIEKKIEIEIPIYFAELRERAAPRALLRDPNKPENLSEQVLKALSETKH